MAFAVAVLVGIAFGAGDQYLGNLNVMVALGHWTVAVSQMSSLWLLLPFSVGATQEGPRRAMQMGLVVTLAALAGYFAMTLSPIEGVALRQVPRAAAGLVASNAIWILGGLVSGPVFGLLGQRWRTARSGVSAALLSGALLLEPAARGLSGRLISPGWVWAAEALAGTLLAAAFLASGPRERRAPA